MSRRHKFEFIPFITDEQELWCLQQLYNSFVRFPVRPKILQIRHQIIYLQPILNVNGLLLWRDRPYLVIIEEIFEGLDLHNNLRQHLGIYKIEIYIVVWCCFKFI